MATPIFSIFQQLTITSPVIEGLTKRKKISFLLVDWTKARFPRHPTLRKAPKIELRSEIRERPLFPL